MKTTKRIPTKEEVAEFLPYGSKALNRPKDCPICAKDFLPVRSDQVYCTASCRNIASQIRLGKRKSNKPVKKLYDPAEDTNRAHTFKPEDKLPELTGGRAINLADWEPK